MRIVPSVLLFDAVCFVAGAAVRRVRRTTFELAAVYKTASLGRLTLGFKSRNETNPVGLTAVLQRVPYHPLGCIEQVKDSAFPAEISTEVKLSIAKGEEFAASGARFALGLLVNRGQSHPRAPRGAGRRRLCSF